MIMPTLLPVSEPRAALQLPAGFVPTSCGHVLDTGAEAFGELRDSSALAEDAAGLRGRMAEDGYLFLRGYLDPAEVLAARAEITARLAAAGALDLNHPALEAVAAVAGGGNFTPEAATRNIPLERMLYTGRMMDFYGRLLGGPVRHYDFTWLRTVRPGPGTKPHCDLVYMGRGTRRLYTAWTPVGDIPIRQGGLIILENSHRQAEKLTPYLDRDVDAYCTNRADAALIESGAKLWQDWDGALAKNPASLREKLGGRWLTAEFRAGDLLTFSMATVHGSLDNQSDRVRISSDSRYQLATDAVDERWVGENPIGHGVAGKRGRIC
jgi:hypothetical protein